MGTETICIDFNGNAYIPKETITVKSAASDEQKFAIYNAKELIEIYSQNGYTLSKLLFRKREFILYLLSTYWFEISFTKKEQK